MTRGSMPSALQVATFCVLLFMALPNILILVISFNSAATLAFPPTGLSLKWYAKVFSTPSFATGLKQSLFLAAVSCAVSMTLGVLASLAIVRFRFLGRQAASVFVMAPLFVPEIVMGIAMLLWANTVMVVSNTTVLVILHCLIVLPYVVRLVVANLQGMDPNLESAAMLLGARPHQAFFHITLPLLGKGLLGAAVFAIVMSFHNFTATMFLVGNRPTLPVAAYQYIRTENDPTVAALSTLMMLGGVLAVYLMEKWIGLERLVR